MRIAVAGATGRIGTHTVTALEAAGHEVVQLSRSLGVDVQSGAGLKEALEGVDAVVDSTNTSVQDEAEIVDFFGSATRNLLAAETAAAVGHHVALSIVGIDHGQPVPHYSGKREQERLVREGPIPYTIVRATQFHDFPEMVVGWVEQDGTANVPPLLMQPIAPAEVGQLLAESALGEPVNGTVEIAGPQTEDFVDMARRTLATRGRRLRLVPTWRGLFGTDMAGEVLLPGPQARLGRITFDDWLAAGGE